jgi:hypothetical protein
LLLQMENTSGGRAQPAGEPAGRPPILPPPALARPNVIVHSNAILYGIQRIDGVDTFKVELPNGAEPDILWIDIHSYLIRRISRNLTVFGGKPGLRWKETILYHPQLDGPVSAAGLTFQPGPEPTDRQRWIRLLFGNEDVVLVIALLALLAALILNRLHARLLRRRWPGRPELWLIPLRRRLFIGTVGTAAVCLGMWLGGAERADVWRNLLVAPFMQQGLFLLYVMQRRSRGHARFAPPP